MQDGYYLVGDTIKMENGVLSHICSFQQSILEYFHHHLEDVNATGESAFRRIAKKKSEVGTSFHVCPEDYVFVVNCFEGLLCQDSNAHNHQQLSH